MQNQAQHVGTMFAALVVTNYVCRHLHHCCEIFNPNPNPLLDQYAFADGLICIHRSSTVLQGSLVSIFCSCGEDNQIFFLLAAMLWRLLLEIRFFFLILHSLFCSRVSIDFYIIFSDAKLLSVVCRLFSRS